MSQLFHTISSSDDDSNDSLPDLQARILSKFSKPPQPPPVHTLSSDDDDEEECNKNNSSEETENDDVIDIKKEENDGDDELDIIEDVIDMNKEEKDGDDELDIIEEIVKPEANITKATMNHSFKRGPSSSDPFEEELPDIQNFTILTSGLDHEDDEQKDETLTKGGLKKLRSEEVREEKEAKRKEREALKHKRELEKAKSKAQKEAERTARRAMKPGECMRFVKVQLDRHLLELPEGSQVISQLQAAELRYEVVDLPVSCAATVLRIDPLSLQETRAEDAVIIVPMREFTELVERQIYHNGVAGLSEQCQQWKMLLGNPRLTLVVAGIQAYLRGKKTSKQQDFRSAVLGVSAQPKRKKKKQNADDVITNVNRIDIETALVMIQLECGVNHRLISDAEKVAAFITQVTKSLAEAPYKREKEDSTFSWYAEGSSVNSVKVDKSGVGLLKLWHQQLQQFNNVGPEVAQAIAREYPSPQALIQTYRHSSSEKEAAHLLADIPVRRGTGPLVSNRRIGPELSKKIHLFFTSVDPEINLGQKS